MVQISDIQRRGILRRLEKGRIPTEQIALETNCTAGDVQAVRGEMIRRREEARQHADKNREAITALLYSEGRPAVIKEYGFSKNDLWVIETRWAKAGLLDRTKIPDARFKASQGERQQGGTSADLSRDFLMGYYTAVKDLTGLARRSEEAD